MRTLVDFLKESNEIEGIFEPLRPSEVETCVAFLALPSLTVEDLETLAQAFEPHALLRDAPGMDVRIGGYIAPAGGPEIRGFLEGVLAMANSGVGPYLVHQKYEHLHPFMDGNGRTGRMVWLWQMKHAYTDVLDLSFLHRFYYQTLANHRDDEDAAG